MKPGQKKHPKSMYVKRSGVGVRKLTDAEKNEFQSHIDRVIAGTLPKLRQWCSLI